jgi:hypothetical protein
MKKDAVSDLAAVREELDHWRSGRSPRQPIPDELWAKAVALLEHHSPTAICRALRLNSARLRERAGSAAPARRRGRPPKARTSPASKAAPGLSSRSSFLEVPASEIPDRLRHFAAPRPSSTSTLPARVLIERPDGARLSVEFAADAPSLEALCSAFLRA